MERFVVVPKILVATLNPTILAVLCSDSVLNPSSIWTLKWAHFSHFTERALVTRSGIKGFFQAPRLPLR